MSAPARSWWQQRAWMGAALLSSLAGCADSANPLTHVSGSTVRIGEPKVEGPDNQIGLRVFTTEEQCDAVSDAERHLCRPFVDRATGTVRIAFQLLVAQQPTAMALNPESVVVNHQRQSLKETSADRFAIIPHEEAKTNHLFILLIDGSGSMAVVDGGDGLSRMDKLKKALLRKDVVESFFPSGTASAVSPLVFRGGLPEPLGGQWLVNDAASYRTLVRDQLQVGSGFTYLYNAVRFSAKDLVEQPDIRQAIENGRKAPTVIALTDGFNNETPGDTCAANVPRLKALLTELNDVRRGKGTRGYQPDIFTVGLGRRAWKKFRAPDDLEVRPNLLCQKWGDQLINGNVENLGVDNAALEWIAKVGGGKSYVKSDAAGLAEAFIAAAQKRYMWYELRYKVDPFHLRRSFDVTIRLSAPYVVEATVKVWPSGWLDGPPGVEGEDGWVSPASFGASLGALISLLGLLVSWNYVPAAAFNVRRALFGLLAPKGGRKG